uniref:Uncharacterized protein n=1 Tax=Daphnia galeata TaxID=27404 RepID=A0A8J2RQE2_9CRUS|nr:unnamed protein product [Daphnia galeata]
MRLFKNGLTMLLVGALVLIVTHLGEVEALGVRPNDTMMGEEHQGAAAGETAVPKVVNRGKVKFQMTKSLMTAVASSSNTNNQVTRTRISRARTTQAPNSIAARDSIENNFSKEEEKTKTTTSKVVWWTSTTSSPIIVLDSLEQDDTVSLEMTAIKPKPNATPSVLISRIPPVNRLNRFRTTTTPVPIPVTRDSLEQDDDDDIVLLTRATTPKSVKKPAAPTQSRFSRVRTTTAAARDSLELNDVSLEVIQVNPAPALNRGRTVSRGQNKLQMTGRRVMTMNRLNRTSQTPAVTTIKTLILADSKEVDLSSEDVALTILSTTQAPAAGTTTETAITTDSEVTTTPAVTISMMQSDERIDLSTEMDDLMTTTTQGTTIITTDSDEIGTTSGTTISKQSNEWDDLDDIFILQTTTTAATTTTPEPTTTTPVSRPQSRGRSRMQTTTTSTTNQIPRVNRVRTTMAPKISEPNESIIMAVLTTTSAPVTRNRFSRKVPAAPATTTMRNTVLGNRFNRFRTTTTTTAAPAAVEKENVVAPKRIAVIPAAKKSRFGNVRTNKIVPAVSDDSDEKETILLGDVLKVNKAGGNNVVLQMMKTETAAPVVTSTRGRLSRGRTTTTAQPIISRHSGEENVSLEDLMVKMNGPTEPVIVADVPLISRHSDEQRDHVSLEQVDKVVVPLDGGLMVLVDVSDEMPATTTLDPISAESTEKDDFTLVVDDVIISAVVPETVVVDVPDMSDEIIPVVVTTTTTVNPISLESEELPIVNKPMTRKIVNRGRVRKPVSQI